MWGGAGAPRLLLLRGGTHTTGAGQGGVGRVRPISTRHCKHIGSMLHVLVWPVCRSGCVSAQTRRSARPLQTQGGTRGTQTARAGRGGEGGGLGCSTPSTLAPESCVHAGVHVCLSLRVVGEQGWGRAHAWSWCLGSQVDAPQVPGGCDGVTLGAQLLGSQGPEPTLLTVHVPALDGRQRHRVGVHADETFVSIPTGQLPL